MFKDKFKRIIKDIKLIFIILIILTLLGSVCYFLFNGISVAKGVTQITPVNVSQNGFICNTKSITAARSSGNVFMVTNGGLKYNVLDKKIYDYLELNIGKSIMVNYEKIAYFHNPCITSEYIITGIKNLY